MEVTSNLHFRIANDPDKGVACIQNKQTIDVEDWSPVEYVWCSKGLRGKDVDFHSWLDILKTAPSVPIDEKRRDDLIQYLNGCGWRLDDESQLFEFTQWVQHMHTQRPEESLHWVDGGQFSNEIDDVHDVPLPEDDDPQPSQLQLPLDSNCIIGRQAERHRLHQQPLSNMVNVGDFIAYRAYYLDTVPVAKRKPMYIGKVTIIDQTNQQVQIRTYVTGTSRPLEKKPGKQVMYKPWRGVNSNGAFQDVKTSDIYHAFVPHVNRSGHFNLVGKEKERIEHCLAGEAVSAVVLAVGV